MNILEDQISIAFFVRAYKPVADLHVQVDIGEGPRGARAPLILGKKRRNDSRKKSRQDK